MLLATETDPDSHSDKFLLDKTQEKCVTHLSSTETCIPNCAALFRVGLYLGKMFLLKIVISKYRCMRLCTEKYGNHRTCFSWDDCF